MYIYINSKLISSEEAVVSVYDHGFLYGLGCFETFRTYGGKVFLLEQHLERLHDGLKDLGIQFRLKTEDILAQIHDLLHVNELCDGYFRLSVSAGAGEIGLPTEDYTKPCSILYIKPLSLPSKQLYERGKALAKLAIPRLETELPVRYKSFHYMSSILAKRELASRNLDHRAEGLFLTKEGLIAEGIVSNLFFVSKGRLCTPSVDTHILPGVTRAFVISLAREQGIPVVEGKFTWGELSVADEIFITSSIQELVPITELIDENGQVYSIGASIGQTTKQLLDEYRKKVRGLER